MVPLLSCASDFSLCLSLPFCKRGKRERNLPVTPQRSRPTPLSVTTAGDHTHSWGQAELSLDLSFFAVMAPWCLSFPTQAWQDCRSCLAWRLQHCKLPALHRGPGSETSPCRAETDV